ncbi:MAG: hypothetical protein E3J35_00655 [Methanomassiliicoccales archaeon]|nr:MAG: hypothetical protein E3J35_00655 [Methanomassiliicoccales archaeon]
MGYGFQLCEWFDPKLQPDHSIVEVKFDGTMAIFEDGRLRNRRKRDITERFPEVQISEFANDVVLVGEVCCFSNGVSDFRKILRRNTDNPTKIRLLTKTNPATYIVFDVLEYKGEDITHKPLRERRAVLDEWYSTVYLQGLNGSDLARGVERANKWEVDKSDPCGLDGILEIITNYKAEGIIVKNPDSPYIPDRTTNWLKLKAWKTKVFEILRHEITDNRGFVIYIRNNGHEQRVAVNGQNDQQRILRGMGRFAKVRYLREEESGALYEGHFHGFAKSKDEHPSTTLDRR